MAGHAAEQVGVVMVLPAEEFLVVVDRVRNAHLVAGGAELRRLVERLQVRLLVQLWLRLHELVVHPLQSFAKS